VDKTLSELPQKNFSFTKNHFFSQRCLARKNIVNVSGEKAPWPVGHQRNSTQKCLSN